MDCQYIEIDNCKIAYIEKNKDAADTIFFIPGNSVSKKVWRKQLESTELSTYRLIAVDFPSHGDSVPMNGTPYTFAGLAQMLSHVVVQLSNNKPYILAGISLGTNIVVEMLAFTITPEGLILAGPCIFGKNYKVDQIAKPGTHVGVVFTDDPDEEDVLSYAHETSLSQNTEDVEIFLEDFKSVKAPFRSAVAKSIFDGNFNDEVALLKEKNIPTLVVFGKGEVVVNSDYLDDAGLPLWNNKVYKIEGASHLVNIDQPVEFNKLMKEFAAAIFR
jgi:pimeloyl-ACP methyl ester carboxylesterase